MAPIFNSFEFATAWLRGLGAGDLRRSSQEEDREQVGFEGGAKVNWWWEQRSGLRLNKDVNNLFFLNKNVNNLFFLNKNVNICFGSHCVSSRVCWETLQDCGPLDQSTTVDVWVDWCVLQVDVKWISSRFQVDWFVLQVGFNQQQHFRTLGPCWTFCWTRKISVYRSTMSLRLNLWSTPHTCRLRVSRFFRAELSSPATMLTCFRAPEAEKFCKTTFLLTMLFNPVRYVLTKMSITIYRYFDISIISPPQTQHRQHMPKRFEL